MSDQNTKTIYRDFNHWWSTSEAHGMTSASKDWMLDIWNEILPTITASQDDYKTAYLELMKKQAEDRAELVDAMLEYIKEFRKDGEPNFWRWYLDKARLEREPPKPTASEESE